MMTCDKCKFWEIDGDVFETRDDMVAPHRKCSRVKQGNGEVHTYLDNNVFLEPAVVVDGEGYKAELWTAGNFGCNAGEER